MSCESLIKAIDAFVTKEDDNLAAELDEAGYAEPTETVERISNLEKQVVTALQAEIAYIESKFKEAIDIDALVKAWPEIQGKDLLDEQIAKIFVEEFKENIPKLAKAYIKKLDPELTVNTVTQRTTDWAKSWSGELGKLMKLNSHTEIESILSAVLKEGKGVDDFARRLMKSGIRDTYYKARRVALTEMLRAHSVAAQESIIQDPSCDRKEWKHAGDYRNVPRPNHVKMGGTVIPKNEPFELKGADGKTTYRPMYPRDTSLPPSESVNCKCLHRGVPRDDIFGMTYEERLRLQAGAIAADDGEWKKELDAKNKAKAGIVV